VNYIWEVHIVLGLGMFLVGSVVGSFLNVCIYRIPLEKSVIWPDSRCPKCLARIGALENVPILSWILLRGACRSCKLRISPRYPLIEAMVGMLFAAVYLVDAHYGFRNGTPNSTAYTAVFYHCAFVAVLVAISFIDYDWTIVPHSLTNFGIFWGLLVPLIDPGIRPAPAAAATAWGALGVGLLGAIVAAGLVLTVRVLGAIAFRREAMGAGDIHILAVVGTVMGWEAAVLTFFLSAFVGLVPAVLKLVPYLIKRTSGGEWNPSDREIPLGPFLSVAAVALLLSWHWVWPRWIGPYYAILGWLVRYLLGQDVA